ncbi:MAG: hypothetical protein EOO04_17905 [Chitinophagaceae bacterium]|nr:MAG: hypothetical protein EOO04_17905 [Chitinophagaceae bacterium]
MQKKLILNFIPLVLVGGILIHCWTMILLGEYFPTWRHYVGLAGYLATVLVLIKKKNAAIMLQGLYLILGTFTLLAFTPVVTISWFHIGPITTPPIQLSSLGILFLYTALNYNTIIDLILDYQEAKS